MSRDTKVGLLGDCAQIAVERARSEFRAGRPPLRLHGAVNTGNRRYLAAKATRAGHQLDHVRGELPEAREIPRNP